MISSRTWERDKLRPSQSLKKKTTNKHRQHEEVSRSRSQQKKWENHSRERKKLWFSVGRWLMEWEREKSMKKLSACDSFSLLIKKPCQCCLNLHSSVYFFIKFHSFFVFLFFFDFSGTSFLSLDADGFVDAFLDDFEGEGVGSAGNTMKQMSWRMWTKRKTANCV